MSVQEEVQKLLYDTLIADAAVMGMVDAVYDDVPSGGFEGPNKAYISIGPSDVVADDADCIPGVTVTFQLDAWSRVKGKRTCRRIVDAMRAALHQKPLELVENALVEIEVEPTRVTDDPDGLTKHGLVIVSLKVELAA